MSTTKYRYPSDIAKLPEADRWPAYLEAMEAKAWQDTLNTRVSAGVGLTDEEVDELVSILGKRCHARTRTELRFRLRSVPQINTYGILGRVHLGRDSGNGPSYCAGQDYTAELPVVRKCLIGG